MNIVERMANGEKISIGMVHTLPLPGTYENFCGMDEITARAVSDAITLEKAGFDALIVENVNDAPYSKDGLTVQQTAAMAIITKKVREAVSIDVGIDTCGDQIAGIDVAAIVGDVTFVRVSSFVDVRIGMTGISMPVGGQAIMRRKELGAGHVKILADVQVKHTYGVCDAISIEQSALWAVASHADSIIVTGITTGAETPMEAITRVKKVVSIPVVVGSGISEKNVGDQYKICDGSIIGSSLKEGKNLLNPVAADKAAAFISAARKYKE